VVNADLRKYHQEAFMAPLTIDNLQSLKGFLGREIGVTDWLALTQERIQQFADATEDRQWIHVDRERAQKESPYGATIAHGFLTLSMLSYFVKQAIDFRGGMRMGINYGLNRVRFPSAVPAGSRIRARISLHSLKELPDCVEAIFSIAVDCEGAEKPCCVAEWIVRYY
jgi:acyl dehydratase